MVDQYLFLVVIILGLVEGLTEFLPISSSFHVVFIGNELGFNDDNRIKFLLNVVLQLGAVFSVIKMFWRKFIVELIRTMCLSNLMRVYKSRLCFIHIVLGMLPVSIFGLVFYKDIKSIFQIRYMFYSLIFGGVLLLVSELFSRRFYVSNRRVISEVNKITFFQAFFVGCLQCLSLFPGFSRSGATISGGLLIGMDRYVASTFSFLLAIPIMLSATVFVLYESSCILFWEDVLFFIIGFFVSFIASFLTLRIFMRIISSFSFVPFAIYRFVLAFLIYFFDLF